MGVSLVEIEFLLMKSARNKSNYAYYHIISGVDLPLHNQDYIHSFIESLGGDKEFVSIDADSDLGTRKIYYIKQISIGFLQTIYVSVHFSPRIRKVVNGCLSQEIYVIIY